MTWKIFDCCFKSIFFKQITFVFRERTDGMKGEKIPSSFQKKACPYPKYQ
jgi:hypothetical protein